MSSKVDWIGSRHPARILRRTAAAATAALLIGSVVPMQAQMTKAEQDSLLALAKETQNPVGNLILFPFQFNFNTGGGLGDGTYFNLNFQPVVPIELNKKWNLIARTIVPINSYPISGGGSETGIGDIQEQLYLTPRGHGKITWGLGPVFSFPTATNPVFRTGSWAVGPGAVVLTMPGKWVVGGLLNQVWTFADDGGPPEVNLLLFQPFVNYNLKKGWALSTSPIITANWDAPSGEEWTVPLGIGLTRTTHFQRRTLSVSVQYYYNVEHPTGSGASLLRFVLSFIFPAHAPGPAKP